MHLLVSWRRCCRDVKGDMTYDPQKFCAGSKSRLMGDSAYKSSPDCYVKTSKNGTFGLLVRLYSQLLMASILERDHVFLTLEQVRICPDIGFDSSIFLFLVFLLF